VATCNSLSHARRRHRVRHLETWRVIRAIAKLLVGQVLPCLVMVSEFEHMMFMLESKNELCVLCDLTITEKAIMN
jgi:hypothetical protein